MDWLPAGSQQANMQANKPNANSAPRLNQFRVSVQVRRFPAAGASAMTGGSVPACVYTPGFRRLSL
jgi:hypothetical protein